MGELSPDADGAAGSDSGPECQGLGERCDESEECCLNFACDGERCVRQSPTCLFGGTTCTTPRDCCSFSCQDGACAEDRCTEDGASCSENRECCSGACEAGACLALTNTCLGSGNPCAENEACCSGFCPDGTCDPRSSYCQQTEDTCANNADCCSGICLISSGALGRCEAPPSGASNCAGGIAGSLCDSCNGCCSRLCEPYGSSGLSICAQSQGCRQTGELCSKDTDCCGGDPTALLPGAGNVTCDIAFGNVVGICRNALSCSPQGNACHLKDYACGVSAASNKCCAADGEVGECTLDALGSPRCNGMGAACLSVGESCALPSDCCDGSCRPDALGALRCDISKECLVAGETCTATAECCPGRLCVPGAPGSFGRCVTSDTSLSCSLVGQLCGSANPTCCGSATCTEGRCVP